MTIGERIKNRREELGMTQDELARKCGYKSRSSINKIELSRDLPLRKVSLMAVALQTSPSYLMGWDEQTYNVGLTAEEKILIDNYRNADDELKRMANRILAYERGLKNDD